MKIIEDNKGVKKNDEKMIQQNIKKREWELTIDP